MGVDMLKNLLIFSVFLSYRVSLSETFSAFNPASMIKPYMVGVADQNICEGTEFELRWTYGSFTVAKKITYLFSKCSGNGCKTEIIGFSFIQGKVEQPKSLQMFKGKIRHVPRTRAGIRIGRATVAHSGTYYCRIEFNDTNKFEDFAELTVVPKNINAVKGIVQRWSVADFSGLVFPHRNPTSPIDDRESCKTACQKDYDCFGFRLTVEPGEKPDSSKCRLLYSDTNGGPSTYKLANTHSDYPIYLYTPELKQLKDPDCQWWTQSKDLTGKYHSRIFMEALSLDDCKYHCSYSTDCAGIDFYKGGFKWNCYVLIEPSPGSKTVNYVNPTDTEAVRYMYKRCEIFSRIFGECIDYPVSRRGRHQTSDLGLTVLRDGVKLEVGSEITYDDQLTIEFALPVESIPPGSVIQIVLTILKTHYDKIYSKIHVCTNEISCTTVIKSGDLKSHLFLFGFLKEEHHNRMNIAAVLIQTLLTNNSLTIARQSMKGHEHTYSTFEIQPVVFPVEFRLKNPAYGEDKSKRKSSNAASCVDRNVVSRRVQVFITATLVLLSFYTTRVVHK